MPDILSISDISRTNTINISKSWIFVFQQSNKKKACRLSKLQHEKVQPFFCVQFGVALYKCLYFEKMMTWFSPPGLPSPWAFWSACWLSWSSPVAFASSQVIITKQTHCVRFGFAINIIWLRQVGISTRGVHGEDGGGGGAAETQTEWKFFAKASTCRVQHEISPPRLVDRGRKQSNTIFFFSLSPF